MVVPQIWINMDGLFHGKSENKIDDLGAALTHINTIIGTTLFSVCVWNSLTWYKVWHPFTIAELVDLLAEFYGTMGLLIYIDLATKHNYHNWGHRQGLFSGHPYKEF